MKKDIKEQLTDLHYVLSSNKKKKVGYLDQIYNEYFNMNWLRPENALYYFVLAREMRKLIYYFEQPILDLGCGDGTFMTIFLGGKFNKTTDSYRYVDLKKKDIYNNYTPTENIITKKPIEVIYGVDWRKNIIKNVRDLGVYEILKENDIRKLSFKDNIIGSVYCNMIDDVKDEDLPTVFKEIHRVLKDDGYVIFTTPTKDFLDCLYYGESIWKPRPIKFWRQFLKDNNFEVVTVRPFMDEKLLRFWDTGFRPYFNGLMELRKLLQYKEMLPEFKAVYVEIFKNYFFDFVKKPLDKKKGFSLIVAKKVKT